MYVCQVKVGELELAARWAVCWTERVQDDGGGYSKRYVRLWGAEWPARQHGSQIRDDGHASMVVVIKVATGPIDQLWIHPTTARDMTIEEVANGWYYAMCYTTVIGDEARKVCDQKQDDVHAEATVRP